MKVSTDELYSLETKLILTLEDIHTGEKIVKEFHNVVCTAGKVAIARKLARIGEKANEGEITYGATGTDSSVPAIGDTTMSAELARKQLSQTSYTNNTCELRTFFGALESVGAIEEFGLFGEDASAVADSGTMFNHALVSVNKSNTQTLTVAVVFEIA